MRPMRDVWGEELVEIGSKDPRTMVLDGDLASSTKADKFANVLPGRFLQMGIAEQNLVGVAAGLASVGLVPWVSTFAVFLTHRALDPIRMLVAQSDANVKLAGAYSGLLIGAVGKTHLDVQDLAIMRAMPGMTVLAPGDEYELVSMMHWAHAFHGPVYMRIARDASASLFGEDYSFVPGAFHTLREGGDVLLVSTGPQTVRVLDAAELLASQGVEATVVHVPCLKPFDADGLLSRLLHFELVVSIEEHSVMGGLGGLVAETQTERSGSPRLVRIGLADSWGESAPNDFLLAKHRLSAEHIADRVLGELAAVTQHMHSSRRV